jgi:hypothetical protein
MAKRQKTSAVVTRFGRRVSLAAAMREPVTAIQHQLFKRLDPFNWTLNSHACE